MARIERQRYSLSSSLFTSPLLLFALTLLVFPLLASSMFAQDRAELPTPGSSSKMRVAAPRRPIPPKLDKPIRSPFVPTERVMVGGPWMMDANWKSSIQLRNIVETDPITVTPILYLSNGRKYVLADLTLEPAGLATININDELQKKGISSWSTLSGYVELQYKWGWDPLCATIRNVDVVHSLIFTYGLRPITPLSLPIADWTPPVPTHTVEGMWWKEKSNVSGFVTLMNISSRPTQAAVQVTDGTNNVIAEYQVTISAHGMKTVNLTALESATATYGGIQVTSSQTTDQLIVSGGLKDQSAGYSAVLPFVAEETQASNRSDITIAALGLMGGAADPMMLFPAGTRFTPYSVLRNLGDAPLSIAATLWWMEGAAARSAQLPKFDLSPLETRALELMDLLSAFGPKNFNGSFNLVLETNAKPESLLMTSGSVDQTNSYVFEVMPRGIAEGGGKSLQYWSTGNGNDTMVTVWNPADEAQDFSITFLFAGGRYSLPLHLESRATRMFNVSEIVHSQVPDAEGNTIPGGVFEGGFKISGSKAENESILVGIDAGVYNVRKATCELICGNCNGYTGMWVVDNPFGLAVSGTRQLNSYANYNTGGQFFMTNGGSWSSTNTGVATVSNNAGTKGLASGVSPGSLTGNFTSVSEPVGVGYFCHSGATSCPRATFAPSSPGSVLRLNCTPTVTRGGSITCTVTPSSSISISNWKFTDAIGTVVTRSGAADNSSTWSGVMATGGMVEVRALPSGGTTPTTLSAPITVNSRTNFAFTAVAATKRANPYSGGNCNISVPTSPAAGNAVGFSCLDQQFFETPFLIGDNGPNQGFRYVYSASSSSTTFNFIVAGYLDDSGSEFAQKQCGNYNPNTNAGYISHAQLKSNTYEHESGNTTGHYATYKSTQNNPANNVGVAVEAVVGPPGQSESNFNNQARAVANSKGSAIASASHPVPETLTTFCNSDVRKDPACVFRGFINWPVYASCQ